MPGVRKSPGVLAALPTALWAALQAAYWSAALSIRDSLVIHDGRLSWTSGGPGAFLPWPRPPGMLQVITPFDSPLDLGIGYMVYYQLWGLVALGSTLLIYIASRKLLARLL